MDGKVVSHMPAAGIVVRRATLEDVEAYSAFGARTFFEAFAADNTPEDMRMHLESAWGPELQRAEILDADLDTLLAVDNRGVFAGFVQLRANAAPPGVASRNPIELRRFYVDKPWQGAGIARALMEAAFDLARQRGAEDIWLGVFERNERAKAFYRKCGFERVGAQVFVVGTDPQTDDLMLRKL
jgi:ribosomal protein S18 acetylase RimI-like enzyme